MDNRKMDERLFIPDDKIAPGVYMRYWQAVAQKYGKNKLNSSALKSYREVRNGAILAALWTKTTGRQHFVSFPHDEPSDVEVYSLIPAEFKGKPTYHLQKIPIQLTRCSLASGETIIGQIKKKNTPALSNVSLVVHMIGEEGATININELVDEVHQLKNIYPREIALIAPIPDNGSQEQTFGQLLIYDRDDSRIRSSKVSLDDKEAFFMQPEIMHNQRRTGRAINITGQFVPLLP